MYFLSVNISACHIWVVLNAVPIYSVKKILVGVFPYILDRWQYSLLNVEQLGLLCVGLELGTMKSIIVLVL